MFVCCSGTPFFIVDNAINFYNASRSPMQKQDYSIPFTTYGVPLFAAIGAITSARNSRKKEITLENGLIGSRTRI